MLADLIVCAAALFGFIFGIVMFMKPRKALYAKMITMAKQKSRPILRHVSPAVREILELTGLSDDLVLE